MPSANRKEALLEWCSREPGLGGGGQRVERDREPGAPTLLAISGRAVFMTGHLHEMDELQPLLGGELHEHGFRVVVPLKLTGWVWCATRAKNPPRTGLSISLMGRGVGGGGRCRSQSLAVCSFGFALIIYEGVSVFLAEMARVRDHWRTLWEERHSFQ
jgi:hypothetical protein